jgi:hypothetical protein
MTAVKVWEYSASPPVFSPYMGNVRRLPNGNTLINWGDDRHPMAVETDPSGNVLYEARFEEPSAVYRTNRYEWNGVALRPYLITEQTHSKVKLIFNKFGDRNIDHYKIYSGKEEDSLQLLHTSFEPYAELTDFDNKTIYYFAVTAVDSSGNESERSNVEMIETNFTRPGENIILNGDFSQGTNRWELFLRDNSQASMSISEADELVINITNGAEVLHSVEISQGNISLINGSRYSFSFDAYSDETRIIDAKIISGDDLEINYGRIGPTVIETSKQNYLYKFNMNDVTDLSSRIVFYCGNSTSDVYIDNVVLMQIDPVSIDRNSGLITDFRLEQNYPNPFNPATTIKYSLPVNSLLKTDNGKQKSENRTLNQSFNHSFNQFIPANINEAGSHDKFVSLKVYDMLGREVATLVEKRQSPGAYTVNFDASNLSSGVYFYRLKYGPFSKIRKMVVIK